MAGCMVGSTLLAMRLAYAEIQFRRGTPAAVERAVGLDRFAPPAAYFERLVDLDPERAPRWLSAALEANPRLSSTWIARGLASELEGEREGGRAGRSSGQFDAAERDLLEAARVDRQYLPAWTLANFYFRRQSLRRQSADQFWIWARRAAELTYDDFRPLLALAHAVEADPRAVIEGLGGGDPLLRADLGYLAAQGYFDDAQMVARLLVARRLVGEAPRLLELAERDIRAGNASYALELWNAASSLNHERLDRRPPNQETLDPERGPVLANGDLLQSPSGLAFDWRLPRIEGSRVAWQPSQLTFSLSGDQPEFCALLEQIVPLARAKRYQLRFEYLTAGLVSPTGFFWDLDGDEGAVLQPASAWIAAATLLHAPKDLRGRRSRGSTAALGKLRLLYRRQPGTVRAEGRLELRHLRMEVL
jgi:hypothetical protein